MWTKVGDNHSFRWGKILWANHTFSKATWGSPQRDEI